MCCFSFGRGCGGEDVQDADGAGPEAVPQGVLAARPVPRAQRAQTLGGPPLLRLWTGELRWLNLSTWRNSSLGRGNFVFVNWFHRLTEGKLAESPHKYSPNLSPVPPRLFITELMIRFEGHRAPRDVERVPQREHLWQGDEKVGRVHQQEHSAAGESSQSVRLQVSQKGLCAGWTIWILHRKLNHFICCLEFDRCQSRNRKRSLTQHT